MVVCDAAWRHVECADEEAAEEHCVAADYLRLDAMILVAQLNIRAALDVCAFPHPPPRPLPSPTKAPACHPANKSIRCCSLYNTLSTPALIVSVPNTYKKSLPLHRYALVHTLR